LTNRRWSTHSSLKKCEGDGRVKGRKIQADKITEEIKTTCWTTSTNSRWLSLQQRLDKRERRMT
jgi:hypothetical protein